MAKLLSRKGTQLSSSPGESYDAGSQQIINVLDPSNDQDVATKKYVDDTTAGSNPLDGTFRILNTADPTKKISFDASGITAATTRSITMPDSNVDLGLIATAIQSSEKGANNGVATLDGSGKVPASQLTLSAMEFQGTWNATTNSPSLADGTGNAGDTYRVTVAGSQDLGSGSISFGIGDWVYYDGSVWHKADNVDDVVSVNGAAGVVVLDTDDISEGATNKYYSSTLFNSDFSGKDTDDLSEGSTNLYYSSSLFATDLAASDTDDLSEGASNLYYTQARFDSAFTAKDTDALSEGATNKYYSSTLFNSDLAASDTDDLSEGSSNLYFTDARAKAAAVSDVAYAASWDGVVDVAPSKNAVYDQFVSVASDISTLNNASGLAFSDESAQQSFAANEVYFVRRVNNSGTAGVVKAIATSGAGYEIRSQVVGFIAPTSAVSVNDTVRVYYIGLATLGSSDSAFAAGDVEKILYLSQSGASEGKWTISPTSASGDILKPIGVVAATNKIQLLIGLEVIEA